MLNMISRICKMKAFHVFGLGVGLTPVLMQFALFYWNHKPHYLQEKATLTFNDKTINLEVARKPEQLVYGLKFRKSMPSLHGMLFVNPRPSIVQLWMKDTYIPLDLVFLKGGVVESIISNVPPCQQSKCTIYSSGGVVDQVVEIGANQASLLGLNYGSLVKIVDRNHG